MPTVMHESSIQKIKEVQSRKLASSNIQCIVGVRVARQLTSGPLYNVVSPRKRFRDGNRQDICSERRPGNRYSNQIRNACMGITNGHCAANLEQENVADKRKIWVTRKEDAQGAGSTRNF